MADDLARVRMTRLCSRCRTNPARSGQSYCAGCHRDYQREWRARRRSEGIRVTARHPRWPDGTRVMIGQRVRPNPRRVGGATGPIVGIDTRALLGTWVRIEGQEGWVPLDRFERIDP